MAFVDESTEQQARRQKWHMGRRTGREWRETYRELFAFDFATLKKTAESAARSALDAAIASYNYLEDHPLAEWVHQHAHLVAEFVGGMFGCHIQMDDGRYWDECPLSLMHRRWGFSPGYTSRRVCSICSEDIDDCPHLLGHRYQVVIKKDGEGKCNGCGWSDCTHSPGQVLEVLPVAVHDSIDLHEVSMVPRPRDPLARPNRIELDTDALRAALGRRPAGEELNCDRCLDPCSGFSHPLDRNERAEAS